MKKLGSDYRCRLGQGYAIYSDEGGKIQMVGYEPDEVKTPDADLGAILFLWKQGIEKAFPQLTMVYDEEYGDLQARNKNITDDVYISIGTIQKEVAVGICKTDLVKHFAVWEMWGEDEPFEEKKLIDIAVPSGRSTALFEVARKLLEYELWKLI